MEDEIPVLLRERIETQNKWGNEYNPYVGSWNGTWTSVRTAAAQALCDVENDQRRVWFEKQEFDLGEKHPMRLLEQWLGTKHLLQDDWNALGWEFGTLPQTHQRIVTLTNYTEAKAEGGDFTFMLTQEWEGSESGLGDAIARLTVIYIMGSGPHGVPWWDGCFPLRNNGSCFEFGSQCDFRTQAELHDFAEKLKHACHEEAHGSYWSTTVLMEGYRPHLTWFDQPYGGEPVVNVSDALSKDELDELCENLANGHLGWGPGETEPPAVLPLPDAHQLELLSRLTGIS